MARTISKPNKRFERYIKFTFECNGKKLVLHSKCNFSPSKWLKQSKAKKSYDGKSVEFEGTVHTKEAKKYTPGYDHG